MKMSASSSSLLPGSQYTESGVVSDEHVSRPPKLDFYHPRAFFPRLRSSLSASGSSADLWSAHRALLPLGVPAVRLLHHVCQLPGRALDDHDTCNHRDWKQLGSSLWTRRSPVHHSVPLGCQGHPRHRLHLLCPGDGHGSRSRPALDGGRGHGAHRHHHCSPFTDPWRLTERRGIPAPVLFHAIRRTGRSACPIPTDPRKSLQTTRADSSKAIQEQRLTGGFLLYCPQE